MLKHIHFTFIFEVSFPFIRVEVLVHSVFTLQHLEAIVPEDCGKTRRARRYCLCFLWLTFRSSLTKNRFPLFGCGPSKSDLPCVRFPVDLPH